MIWCNAFRNTASEKLLIKELEGYEIVFSKQPEGPIPEGVEVIFGHPDPENLIALDALKWVHLDSAGYTPYDTLVVREFLRVREIPLSNSSPVYADPCAQHLLALMLAGARQLPQAFGNVGGWDQWNLRAQSSTLTGQTVMLLGYGQIGQRLAELLAPFKAGVLAVRRQAVVPHQDVQVISPSEIREYLGEVDHLVNILPDNPSTRGFVEETLFRDLKEGATFYNIGRGTTVDQDSLAKGLSRGRPRAAFLDVTDPEPLPPDHALWQIPNCHITPHTGGGQSDEFPALVRHFAMNWRRFRQNLPLISRVF